MSRFLKLLPKLVYQARTIWDIYTLSMYKPCLYLYIKAVIGCKQYMLLTCCRKESEEFALASVIVAKAECHVSASTTTSRKHILYNFIIMLMIQNTGNHQNYT